MTRALSAFYYNICGLPFDIQLRNFSQEEIKIAKKIYLKFGVRRFEIKEKGIRVHINRKNVKTVAESLLMRPIIDKFFDLQEKFNFLLLHSAGFYYQKKGFIFPAPGGGGKTSISKIAKKKSIIISDDCLIIKKVNSSYLIYGLPLTRPIFKAIKYQKRGFRLGKIYFPVKSKLNKVKSISKNRAFRLALIEALRLTPQRVAKQERPALRMYAFKFLDELLEKIPFAELYFLKNNGFLKKI